MAKELGIKIEEPEPDYRLEELPQARPIARLSLKGYNPDREWVDANIFKHQKGYLLEFFIDLNNPWRKLFFQLAERHRLSIDTIPLESVVRIYHTDPRELSRIKAVIRELHELLHPRYIT